MSELKPILLCADDFAQDRAISSGILALAEAGRLSAVSCFSDSPLWPELGRELTRAHKDLLIGLHFNLTHPFGFAERPLWYWMVRSVANRLDTGELRAALERQLARFTEVAGRLPDYIDGHQHVHAFPRIRDVVAEAALSRPGRVAIPIRDVSAPVGPTDAPVKRAVIRALARLGRMPGNQIPLNSAFAGDYSLSPNAPYARLLAGWLTDSPAGTLIMCHPGHEAPGVVPHARAKELEVLASPGFQELLTRNGCRLARGLMKT